MGISDKLETYLRLKSALDRLADAYIGLSIEEYLSVMDKEALGVWEKMKPKIDVSSARAHPADKKIVSDFQQGMSVSVLCARYHYSQAGIDYILARNLLTSCNITTIMKS
jgi:hypothetical protein